jgi:hypothetical protein
VREEEEESRVRKIKLLMRQDRCDSTPRSAAMFCATAAKGFEGALFRAGFFFKLLVEFEYEVVVRGERRIRSDGSVPGYR